jgi:hypothetical protein
LYSFDVFYCKDAHCLIPLFINRIEILNSVASNSDAPSKWTGEYERYWKGKIDKNSATLLLIGLSNNRIFVSGDALWVGQNVEMGEVNIAELNGVGVIQAEKAIYNVDECRAILTREIDEVNVESDSICGGLNVTFAGKYRKKWRLINKRF